MAHGAREHRYAVEVVWTGNRGEGTTGYRAFDRNHEIRVEGKPTLTGSADPAFRGDPTHWNPEDLLVSSLSECHMLWFLHLAAVNGVVVTDYRDTATGTMAVSRDGDGQFTEVTLHPRVTVRDADMVTKVEKLHTEANAKCFIARSVNFPVHHAPETLVAPG
ncbi:OsmC family protein [Spiractinospora alimapuensis]|uniref:OsmC family protein n=1 Tax=Spiractinospora alimapuensis TaxID=2820884 RepID=UPI001F269A95|nr:OsmC family protein [Spiractinospora alimapuensis]QVQ50202.1 OsmC family protein [Spiractinospora alimapuensis]